MTQTDHTAQGRAGLAETRRVIVEKHSEVLRDHLRFGEPEGAIDRINVTSKWLERNGQPWVPVTGEIHYSRIPRDRWVEVAAKAAAGGLNSVAAYVFWQVHEPVQGEYRWDDNRDLRAFIEICAAQGLDVIVRMGPWSHGEARFGGFPDWLINLDIPLRTNDERYLELVRPLYAQMVEQMRGLTHKEGGPIVGVQLENELYDNSDHLATLRVIAEDLGLDVPLWTGTGWGGAEVPETLFPLYSAYSEGFWEESDVEWPPFAPYHFLYSEVRDDLNVGKDLREALDGIIIDPDKVPLKDDSVIPFATCELGGGMHVAYHRRPLVFSEDVANLALAKIGSGSIWQGYYMYSGGTIRKGPNGTEQESHATGYPNDVPTRTYDFYAPLNENNQVNPHYHMLRRQHLWLELDGPQIATMRTIIGGGSPDPEELRWAVRSDGHRGYAFFTTYQPPKAPISAQENVQVTVEFEDGAVTVPTSPIDLPQGVSVAWPLRFPVTADLTIRSATAQVLTTIADDSVTTLLLVATPGVPVEIVLEGEQLVTGDASTRIVDGATVVELTKEPSLNTVIETPDARIIVLDDATANTVYKLEIAGRERLISSTAPVYETPAGAEIQGLVLHTDTPEVTLNILPAPSSLTLDQGSLCAGSQGIWGEWTLTVDRAGSRRIVENLAPQAAIDPQAVYGGPMNRLSAPTDFTDAAHLHLEIPADAIADVDRALLRINWTGDVGRAEIGGDIVSDHFWYGRNWDVDLTPHAQAINTGGIDLHLMPWKRELGIWVDPSVRDIPDGISVKSVDVIAIPRITVTAQP